MRIVSIDHRLEITDHREAGTHPPEHGRIGAGQR
jgi:hypothetical protein